MKKFFVIIFSAIALVGCTLEEQVISSSEPATYYQTIPQCLTGLNGCYIPLRSIYSNADYFEACEVATDLIYHSSASYYDAHCDYTQSIPRFGNTIWNQCYLGVMRCNAMYQAIENSPLLEEEKAPLLAEAVVLRAFYYYILTINFGDVPYYFEPVTDANNDKIASMGRQPAKELRTELMNQLEDWLLVKQALPMVKTYDPSNDYRIGAMVGCVIGGKLAMWNNRFDRAIEFFEPIEKVYGTVDADGVYKPQDALMGYPVKDIMFRNRYTAESIFELPGYSKDYGLRVTQQLASRCTPARKSTGDEGSEDSDAVMEDYEDTSLSERSDVYDGVSIPSLGDNARTTSPYRPTKYLYQYTKFTDHLGNEVAKGLMPYNTTDKRRSVYDTKQAANGITQEVEDGGGYLAWCWVGRGLTPEGKVDLNSEETIRFFKSPGSYKGRPYLGDKFWCPGMNYTQDSNNLKIFRFAHVILDLAESHMRCGHWDLAAQYLNAVKQRAGVDDRQGVEQEESVFMKNLQEESARELLGEFTRRHNLVRWGIWHDQIAKYSDDSNLRANVLEGPCRQYYPIPDQQVILSNYNLDNKEYEKYGL